MPTALITGSARRIGQAIARHLLEKGWRLIAHVNSSQKEGLELQHAFPGQVQLLMADLAMPEERDRLARELLDGLDGQKLDLLLHNASIFPHARLEETDDDLIDRLFALHLKAPLFLSSALAPALAKAPDGLIITMLDAGASLNWPGYLAYSLSKQSLENLTLALARELAPKIRVNGIAPGFILPPEDAPGAYRKAEARRLTQQEGKPESLLLALDYLLESPFVTGEILQVDGGRRLLRP